MAPLIPSDDPRTSWGPENPYKNVREKATPPTQNEIFADVVHNEAFEGDENEMKETAENKCSDL